MTTEVLPPRPRGPLSRWVIERMWAGGRRSCPSVAHADGSGDDVQLALFLAYEPHFRRIGAADEWDAAMLDFRARLEALLEAWLIDRVGPPSLPGIRVDQAIPSLIAADDGPSVSQYMEHLGTLDQFRQFVVHRSLYQLKEGDGHTLGISRLQGRAKQLLAAIQAGEYGADEPGRRIHSELFASTMRGLGLDDRPGAYLDVVPASAMLVSNVISMFGLHRRWRAALVGHLAVFEMTSVTPMGRYSNALARLGVDEDVRRFYDVHVLADAEHEHMALDMAVAQAEQEPETVGEILFGSRVAIEVERCFATDLLASWDVLQPAA